MLESLEELYRAHFDYVWKSALRLGVPRGEAEDVVQETFLRMHRLLQSEQPINVRAWIFAVLLRVVQHWRRSSQRRRNEGEGDALDGISAPVADPETRAEVNETVRMLEAVLDTLTPEKRAVLVLSELEQRSLPEIAEILGINLNTAASRLRFARHEVIAGMARHRARDGWRMR
jgi:RNA polymerase sigma-70 factor (ECF subfamily)